MSECLVLNSENNQVLYSQRVLEDICKKRKFFAGGKGGQLDLGRAAKLILSDYVAGNLIHCLLPPTTKYQKIPSPTLVREIINAEKSPANEICREIKSELQLKKEEKELEQWMTDALLQTKPQEKRITKRKMRFLLKAQRKGGAERIQI
ncbi:GTP-binding protein [Babesia duncani]|uniref:GTP-binding protein n=1 Tax=Babesia duncani TaxID=323732 RepID=A0AAD9PJB0_9APIC|nr:GTP-binding protein [Babesia duncani]